MNKISQKQELKQQLTPKQILQASLLKLNLPLLEQRIIEELEINPALELLDMSKDNLEEVPQDKEEEIDTKQFFMPFQSAKESRSLKERSRIIMLSSNQSAMSMDTLFPGRIKDDKSNVIRPD